MDVNVIAEHLFHRCRGEKDNAKLMPCDTIYFLGAAAALALAKTFA